MKPFQYSLRTLFIVITAFALWLGFAMWPARSESYYHKMVGVADKLVDLNDWDSNPYYGRMSRYCGWMRKAQAWPNVVGCDTVTGIRVHGKRVSNENLKRLVELPDLQFLIVGGPTVTEAGLKHLTLLPNLKELWLLDVPLNAGAIRVIKSLSKLTELHLQNCSWVETDVNELEKAIAPIPVIIEDGSK